MKLASVYLDVITDTIRRFAIMGNIDMINNLPFINDEDAGLIINRFDDFY